MNGLSARRLACAPALTIAALLAAMCLGSGCALRVYRATSLPVQFEAPRVANAQTVDLSRLAVPAVRSNVVDAGDVIEVTLASGADDKVATFPLRGA